MSASTFSPSYPHLPLTRPPTANSPSPTPIPQAHTAMDSDRHMSRHRPQLFDSPGHASFLGDASDASPFQDTTRDLEASWMASVQYICRTLLTY